MCDNKQTWIWPKRKGSTGRSFQNFSFHFTRTLFDQRWLRSETTGWCKPLWELYYSHTTNSEQWEIGTSMRKNGVIYAVSRKTPLYSKSMHTNNSFHALDTFPPPVCYNNNKKLPHNLRRGFLLIRKPLLDWLHSPLVCQDALDTQFWRIWVVAPRTSGSIRLDLGQRIRDMPIKYSWTDINQKNVF